MLVHLRPELLGRLPGAHRLAAGVGRDGEARGHRDAERGHLREADPLAAEQLAPAGAPARRMRTRAARRGSYVQRAAPVRATIGARATRCDHRHGQRMREDDGRPRARRTCWACRSSSSTRSTGRRVDRARRDELRRRVEPIVAGDAWVVDGSYRMKLGDLVLDAARHGRLARPAAARLAATPRDEDRASADEPPGAVERQPRVVSQRLPRPGPSGGLSRSAPRPADASATRASSPDTASHGSARRARWMRSSARRDAVGNRVGHRSPAAGRGRSHEPSSVSGAASEAPPPTPPHGGRARSASGRRRTPPWRPRGPTTTSPSTGSAPSPSPRGRAGSRGRGGPYFALGEVTPGPSPGAGGGRRRAG